MQMAHCSTSARCAIAQSLAAMPHTHGTRPCIRPAGRRCIAARASQSASVDVAQSGRCDRGHGAAHAPVNRRAALWTAAVVGGALCTTPGAVAEVAQVQMEGRSLEVAQRLEQLQVTAIQAYRAKDLQKALEQLTEIVALDGDNPVWYERRGQVYVDLKSFDAALSDFDTAQRLQPPNYVSLGLLANKGLAHEGLSQWQAAVDCYTQSIDLGRSVGADEPYILNSRGNCFISLGDYRAALRDFDDATAVFTKIRNVNGAVYAASNAALMWAQLGDDERGIKELEKVARRAPGSIDMRAALAAMHWSRGEEDIAEQYWGWACSKINSGQIQQGGPVLDGCALYRDQEWLAKIRRWPPLMVQRMDAFLKLRST